MNTEIIGDIAVIHSKTPLVTNGQSALEFAVNSGAYKIIVNKEAITEDFFNLSSGIAGEVAQKLVNYGYRLAVVGNFSQYKSKSLRSYMYECNNGKHLYFAESQEEAIEMLRN